jgi:hypothetical protein
MTADAAIDQIDDSLLTANLCDQDYQSNEEGQRERNSNRNLRVRF